ncbi:hypothetical protein NHQ30_011583 [Ciborinia camelliae]|nr:hypothetical protein NHQ30_011583 [Ciborinia camelliae]
MGHTKGIRRSFKESLRDFQPFSFLKKSSTQPINGNPSTSVHQSMPSSDLPRRFTSGAFSSINRRRKRQQRQASNQNDPRPSETQTQENRPQVQACSPPSSDFGPYEDPDINDRRQLPFLIQHGVFFKMCITLEGAIFDFTKLWAPEFLINKDLSLAQEVELNFWERYLAAPIIPVGAFENHDDIPRYHELLDRFKEIRHVFVHRKKPPVWYVDQMLEDAIELTVMIGDETRTEKLNGMYQIVHHMGNLLRDKVSIETKGILEDQLQAVRHAQKVSTGWLGAIRLQEEELQILEDLNQNTDRYEALYADTLQALGDMMKPVSDFLVG